MAAVYRKSFQFLLGARVRDAGSGEERERGREYAARMDGLSSQQELELATNQSTK